MGGTKALGGNKLLFREQKETCAGTSETRRKVGKAEMQNLQNVNLGFVFQAIPLHTFQSRYQPQNFTYVSIKKQLFPL